VRLQQADVYRLGPQRWLYAPPRAEFWGETRTVEHAHLIVSYPARDETLVTRLAADLDALLDDFCRLDCVAPLHLSFRLSTAPAAVARGAPLAVVAGGETVVLPAPTLVGTAIDEAGYRALFVTYGRYAVAAAVAAQLDWSCCERGLLLQALLNRQLQALGLDRLPSHTPEQQSDLYASLLQTPGFLDDVASGWTEPPLASGFAPTVQVYVDFLLEQAPDRSLLSLQQALLNSNSYGAWLAEFGTPYGLRTTWLRRLYALTAVAAPPPRPTGDALLLCHIGARAARLYHFSPNEGRVTGFASDHIYNTDRADTLVYALPDGKALVVEMPTFLSGVGLRLYLWDDGDEQLLWNSADAGAFRTSFKVVSSNGQHLLLQRTHLQSGDVRYLSARIDTCTSGSCSWQMYLYRPLWSPDGAHALFSAVDVPTLYVGSDRGEELRAAGFGHDPFWLDADSYGFFRETGGGIDAAMLGSIAAAADPQPWFAIESLPDLSPSTLRADADFAVIPGLDPGEQGYVAVRPTAAAPTYVYAVPRRAGDIALLFTADGADPDTLALSPDGRWLTLVVGDALLLHALDDGRTFHYPLPAPNARLAWSPTGDWLFVTAGDMLLALAPASSYHEVIAASPPQCTGVAWLLPEAVDR
jgi:hypothetical protein